MEAIPTFNGKVPAIAISIAATTAATKVASHAATNAEGYLPMMPCNPSIGGPAKGVIVKEIDALGGEMGKNIDKTFIQSKMLNVSKGPAVHSLRAQADKQDYSREMRKVLENQDHLTIKQAEVTELLTVEDLQHINEKNNTSNY